MSTKNLFKSKKNQFHRFDQFLENVNKFEKDYDAAFLVEIKQNVESNSKFINLLEKNSTVSNDVKLTYKIPRTKIILYFIWKFLLFVFCF